MARIASLIGIDSSGECMPIAQGDAQLVVDARKNVIEKNGVVKVEGKEVKLSEIRCLSTGTAGGELKPRYRFTDKVIEGNIRQAEARAKANKEADASEKKKKDREWGGTVDPFAE